MQDWPDLRRVLGDLPWAIVGGVATRAYMAERMTHDLDVIVRHVDGEAAVARMRNAGYAFVGELSIPGQTLRSPEGKEVDVLFGDQPWLDEALEATERDPAGLPVLGLPFLVVLKLKSARTQPWVDVSRMVGQASDGRLAMVRDVVQRWSPDDVEDLEALIYLGQQEIEAARGAARVARGSGLTAMSPASSNVRRITHCSGRTQPECVGAPAAR